MPKDPAPDPRITKRRVTMRSVSLTPQGTVVTTERVDYVPDDERGLLEPYVALSRQHWQYVEVSEEFDAGPGGYDGATYVMDGVTARSVGADGRVTEQYHPFTHPLAGTFFPATGEDGSETAPRGARIVTQGA